MAKPADVGERKQSPDQAFLARVKGLARSGLNQQQIAAELGYTTTATLTSRLLRASQRSRRPVPAIGRGGAKGGKSNPVETVQIARRGKGDAFGVNVPEEPLRRAGVNPGDTLKLTVRRNHISLRK